jgi:hypothetical protein
MKTCNAENDSNRHPHLGGLPLGTGILILHIDLQAVDFSVKAVLTKGSWALVVTLVILATWVAEIGRIKAEASLGK